jgi:hypothetical protein
LANPISRIVRKIREINKRYAKPRVRMSRGTRFALLVLRLYLISLVILLAYRFATLVLK